LSLSDRATAKETINSHPLKVGFTMAGTLNDLGWNYQHNQGRLYMESKLKESGGNNSG